MLQASEYDLLDFFKWHERVSDFRRVERRKHLVFTAKALALFALGWVFALSVLGVAAYVFMQTSEPFNYIIAAILLLEAPAIVFCGLVFVVLVLHTVQAQVENYIISSAKERLRAHHGFRIAIAGSYGKTSMREILRTVLSEGLPAAPGRSAQAGKKVAAPQGSHNTPLAISSFIQGLKGDEEVLIFELGEYYPGDVKKLSELVQPDLGVITGVNEAHLKKFKTVERIAHTIFELADFLREKPLYVNGENEVARRHAKPHNILYDKNGAGEIKVSDIKTGLQGTTFIMREGSKSAHVNTKLLGRHTVGPLAAAAHIAKRLGLTHEQMIAGLSKTIPFEHRLQMRVDGGVITLDDSYNGNPDGVKAVIDFLASVEAKRKWYVTPGLVEMGDKKEEIHRTIGKQLAQAGIEKVLLIRNSVTPFIEEGLKAAGYAGGIHWYDDALEAYKALPLMTLPGDVVLLQNDWPDQYA